MHDRWTAEEDRISRFLDGILRPALHPQRIPLDIGAWQAPGEPVPVRIALRAGYAPFLAGDDWGRPWSTTWFRLEARVPERWAGRRVEALVDLGSGDPAAGPARPAEALVHDASGIPLQGLHGGGEPVTISAAADGGERIRLLVEAAATPFVDTRHGPAARFGNPATAGGEPLYRFRAADLAVRDEGVWQLIHDIETLGRLMRELPAAEPRRHRIRTALVRAADAVDPQDIAGTVHRARTLLAPELARRAHESAQPVIAFGHARVDTGRLPVHESIRRASRAFATAVSLAEEYPELVFAASSAQHYAWMRDHQPHIFERIRKAVADGNWAPVGGMWVEADPGVPGGESLVRQFVHGHRFFRDEFAVDTDGVWLPAAPELNGALPQLAALAGARWLLAPAAAGKTPAEGIAVPPGAAFHWEGIDGTRIPCRLAPADPDGTGPAALGPAIGSAAASAVEAGPEAPALLPLGASGAGGAVPTRELLEAVRRLHDLEGSPRVTMGRPADAFKYLVGGDSSDGTAMDDGSLPAHRGELRLAAHHGTYSAQARTKRGNRRAEALLREAELWSVTAAVHDGVPYPYQEIDTLWKRVLLHQAQDVAAGTGISWVHQETELEHRDIHRRLEALIRRVNGPADGPAVLNAAPYDRREVVVVDADPLIPHGQDLADGRRAHLAEAPALGTGRAGLPLDGTPPVTVRRTPDGGYLLANGLTSIRVDARGLVGSVCDLATGRDAIAPGRFGNLLRLRPDGPAGRPPGPGRAGRDLTEALSVRLTDEGPLMVRLRVERTTGRSTVVQELSLAAGGHALAIDTAIDWRERDSALQSLWPLDVHAEHVLGDIAFGLAGHATDVAAAHRTHRWLHIGEHRWGVALASDTGHGYDVVRRTRDDGGSTTTLRLTLLGAGQGRDPHADRGPQLFRHTLRPGADPGDAITEGYRLDLPLRPGRSARPLLAVDHPDVVVEAVKLADDHSGDVVVRLYEARGGRARTTLTAGFALASVCETDLLERPLAGHPHHDGDVTVCLRPFQILTLRLAVGGTGA
ncbi:glycoside hydrolase family 38 C-terminal domain-containing protein [Streptomyces sp. RTGN2]|uniref:alpha-mannosidase n=1 Tax=Streptomyces sp. RTGN2 TaxID=3016525 RepID=UPI0025528B6D|nr:glycoside hydrolase family 38 C-terminal domain-containing protein [Streptomyces sp. RTGN2]